MSILDFKPSLAVLTTYLHDSDREEAAKLGEELYDLLTRPLNDPLSQGASIPVLPAVDSQRVDPSIAKVVVVIVVLGASTFFLRRRMALRQLSSWHKQLGDGHLLLVPTSNQWRMVESDLPSKQLLSELYGGTVRRQQSLQEIVFALTRVVPSPHATRGADADSETDSDSGSGSQLRIQPLFISHAKADLKYTDVANVIHKYVSERTTGTPFFDAKSLLPGIPLAKQLDTAAAKGVMVAVQGDAYSSRSWCQRELLTAKRHGIPTLIVNVLKDGEKRSSPYSGNSPTIVWKATEPAEEQAAKIVSRCMVEWLRATHFANEAKRICDMTQLPEDTAILTRPPELLDVAHGKVKPHGVVLYPDPELPVAERQLLETAYPRLKLVTPTTAYRNYLGAQDVSSATLEGNEIAFSISDSPDVDGPDGYTKNHMDDAVLFLARTLISAGAAIAYGGDFRRAGYTERFSELILSYNETANNAGSFLNLYQDATFKLDRDNAPHVTADMHLMSEMAQASVQFGSEHDHPKQLYMSDMRRVMSELTSARIIAGGKVIPKLYEKDDNGYSGLYPGVVEEAWQTLVANKPLYVIGGFGGAASLVAQLLTPGKKTVPALLMSKTWKNSKVLQPLTERLLNDKSFQRLKLPKSMDDLANRIKKIGQRVMKSDSAAKAWNGLNRQENALLFTSRDPLVLATLVLKGLLEKNRSGAQGKLNVELVRGSVTSASSLNAIAVATFDQIPLAGAGAALDRAVAGQISQARAKGQQLVRLDAAGVDADWLYLASLGSLDKSSQTALLKRVQQAAEATRQIAQRHDFHRLGVVSFGGTIVKDFVKSATTVLNSLIELGNDFKVTWFETDTDKFDILRRILTANPDVTLTTKEVQLAPIQPTQRDESLIIQLRLHQQKLSVTVLPPSGTAIVSSDNVALTDAEVDQFGRGGGRTNRATPPHADLLLRGASLTRKILGENADAILEQCEGRRIMIIHDEAASRLPLETLTTLADKTPLSVRFGLSRRLAISGASIEQLFSRMVKSGRLNLLLIANPTSDLPGTETEASRVQQLIKPLGEAIKLRVLLRKQATIKAVREEIAQADVLHYCGHAFFDAPGENSNGLMLANDENLTLSEMRSIVRLPRFAFVNACEAGRVRGVAPGVHASKAFAEFFLRSGIEAFLGTYWQVSDAGAATFATNVYSSLIDGTTLDKAVKDAKASLFKDGNNEWANYILYGNGSYRLIETQRTAK